MKLGDKVNKPPVELIDLGFVVAMAECMGEGAGRPNRAPGCWRGQTYASATMRHTAKILRHLWKFNEGKDRMKHAAAIACNAMILWWHEKEKHGG